MISDVGQFENRRGRGERRDEGVGFGWHAFGVSKIDAERRHI